MTPPLFVSVGVPESVAARLAALAGGVPGARWVPAGNMHVTVRYLGELDDVLAGEVSSGLAEIGGSGFSLEAGGVGCFGKRGAPRLLYAGVRPHEDLTRLRRRMEGLFRRLRIPPDGRKYHPHITLARLKGASPERVGRFLEANSLLASPPFGIGSFTLHESHRGEGGSVYRALRDYPLQAAPDTLEH